MKRFFLVVMSLLALLLSACGTPPSPPVSENPLVEISDTFVFPEIELEGRKPWNWRDYPDTSWIHIYIVNPEHTELAPRPIVALDNNNPIY